MYTRRKNPRRKFPRADVDWPVTVISAQATAQGRINNIRRGGPLQGRVKNISRGGALLYLSAELDPQERIYIDIAIPEFKDILSAEGEVVRALPVKSGNSPPAGIQFTAVSEEVQDWFPVNPAKKGQGLKTFLPQKIGSGKQLSRNIAYSSLILLNIALAFLVYRSSETGTSNSNQIALLDQKIQALEGALNTSRVSNESLVAFRDTINAMQDTVSGLEKKITRMPGSDKASQQVTAGKEQAVEQLPAELQHPPSVQVAPLVEK